MENNFIQMAASAIHAVAYTIGPIFKHIIDCVQPYFAIELSSRRRHEHFTSRIFIKLITSAYKRAIQSRQLEFGPPCVKLRVNKTVMV